MSKAEDKTNADGLAPAPEDWSVYAAPINSLLLASEQLGAPRQRLLAAASLDEKALIDPENRVAVRDYFRLFKVAEALTHCADIGLYAGRISYLTGLNLQLYMATICHTFRDYLNLMPSVLKMWGDIGEVKIRADGDYIRLEWRPLDPATGDQRFLTDVMLSASAMIVDSLCVLPIPARRVGVTYSKPGDTGMLERMLGPDISYSAEISCLYFDRVSLGYPLVQQNYRRAEGGLIPFADLFDGKDPSDKFWSRLRQSIVRLLPLGDLSMQAVAADMHMASRTLQRQLQQRGSCFRDEVRDIRSQLAIRYLSDHTVSVTDTAFMLGYNDQGAFTNAFKSWHACAPSEYRQKNQISAKTRLS